MFFKIPEHLLLKTGIFVKTGKLEKLPLEKLPFVAPITPVDSIPTGPKGLDGWPEEKLERLVKFRVDMLESGLSLVRAGEAAIFIPNFLARLHNEVSPASLRLVEISHQKFFKTVYRDVYLMKRKSMKENELVKKLARMIRTECF